MSQVTQLPNRPPLEEVAAMVQGRLERLPGTADAIAEFLAAQDLLGYQRSAFNCALGRFLAANLHSSYLLRVDDEIATIIDAQREGRAGNEIYVFPLLAAVTTFLGRFDAGDYRNLLETSETNARHEGATEEPLAA